MMKTTTEAQASTGATPPVPPASPPHTAVAAGDAGGHQLLFDRLVQHRSSIVRDTARVLRAARSGAS